MSPYGQTRGERGARLLVAVLLCGAPSAFAGEIHGGFQWYVGDLHAHTANSGDGSSSENGCEGCGAQADIIATAQANGLDFVAFSDHTNGYTTETGKQFRDMVDLADASTVPDAFVVLPAAELYFQAMTSTGFARYGHKNILFFGGASKLAGLEIKDVRIDPDDVLASMTACSDFDDMLSGLAATYGNVLALPHHPAATVPTPTDWSCQYEEWSPAVEVYSVHGNSLSESLAWDVVNKGSTASGYVDQALDPAIWGHRLGFVGGTDRHDTLPGEVCKPDQFISDHIYGGSLTMVAMPSGSTFDRGTLYDAIVARHTASTSGPFLPVNVSYTSAGEEIGWIGDDLGVPVDADLTVTVTVPEADADFVTGVTLQVPGGSSFDIDPTGVGAWSVTIPSDELPEVAYVQVQVDGAAFWSTGCDDGGSDAVEYVWVSPSKIEQVDYDHDGWSVAQGDCDDADPTFHPEGEVWYDGIDQGCDEGSDYDADADHHDALPWGDDCDDTNFRVHPEAPEIWYDGIDGNCDGWSDFDADHDGHERQDEGDDCDDANRKAYPGADEIWYDGVDENCDGADDYDADGDGWPRDTDCNDRAPTVFPGAPGWTEDCERDPNDTDGGGPPGGCGGCATGGGSPVGLLGLVALIGLRRRSGRLQELPQRVDVPILGG